jgi:hypothetical protein
MVTLGTAFLSARLKLTGILLAKVMATLAMSAFIPGGKRTATRSPSQSFFDPAGKRDGGSKEVDPFLTPLTFSVDDDVVGLGALHTLDRCSR